MNMKTITYWALRIIPAIILLQTLYFKFSAAPESVYIFTTLGMEPYGRIGSGIAELIAGILLVIPATSLYGAVLALGIMGGAIMSHLTKLGISVMDDGGYLFGLAIVVALCSAVIVWLEKDKLWALAGRKK
jgi:uncharacterized membrane protein YphA (DoxX/SURF4 family)